MFDLWTILGPSHPDIILGADSVKTTHHPGIILGPDYARLPSYPGLISFDGIILQADLFWLPSSCKSGRHHPGHHPVTIILVSSCCVGSSVGLVPQSCFVT